MSIEIKIPEVGESISEVQIAEWLKSDGDTVNKDENLAVIDSEKTTLELPSPESGRLKILHQAGDTVKVGEIVARIESGAGPEKSKSGNGEVKHAEEKKPKAGKPAPQKKEAPSEPAAAKKTAEPEKPAEKKPEAQEAKTAAPPQPTPKPKAAPTGEREEEIVPMTMLRRTAARRLVEAKQQMAMLTTFNEVDVSAVQNLRHAHQEQFEKRYQVKLGFMSFFVKAVIDALKQFPALNAEIRNTDVVYHNYFDIGVAIASDRGLVVPVLRGAERMSFSEIEKTIADFAKRARDGKLKPDDLEGGTFTITNGGVFGSLLSTPIINPPQTGILGMHSVQERPIALNSQVVIRPMMFIALTYDHRLVDGREAVLFLRRIKEAIENPARMLIEI